ncbi:MAG: serine hydrolase domain-containing protein [Bacteroidota bacterium]|uniref:Beta-lactamase family protein n=1 Tax=Flagellimonas profundi TaxID=2915620 RepID=A0ABS3FBE1_9FLAO|nr:serine hydrolase domain-containing protein [Allomuricauda profundi]MBO0340476.1 beta-lactamase family protein [Allomuricauda profundi]MEC7770222.1 serine hydrolase domain-containing protein [Bacteroidota bacterium]
MKLFPKLCCTLTLIICTCAKAQISEEKWANIDSLFLEWNRPNHPGGAIAVMQGDDVVFSKAYGLASMEYLVPNSTGTRFNVASVSKQFSALGIIKLHLAGKLSIDDTLDKYIDGLAPFGSKITIRHMLHHTSGLRSLHALFGLAGWRSDDTRTNADLDRIMAKQAELNFEPGSEYMYCNTGYMFLANIIEKVTDTSFVDYMKEEVFIPLGMSNTYVEANYDRIVPDNATSYYRTLDGFDRAVEYWGYVGSGNMHSTTDDLLKYLKNYYDPLPGWKDVFSTMQTLDLLNDGSFNKYAFGVNVDTLLGKKRIGHGGSIGGFRANIAVFPQDETSIAIATNFSTAGPARKSDQVAAILFDKRPSNKDVKVAKVSKNKMESYLGTYWDDETYTERMLTIGGDTIYIGRNAYLPIQDDEFVAIEPGNDTKIKFNNQGMTLYPDSGKPMVFSKFEKEELTRKSANAYTGSYYSPEIETAYTIRYEEGQLYAHHIRHGKIRLEQKKTDLLEGTYPLSFLKFKRENGAIKGVWISNGRVRNLWFAKSE